MAGFGFTATGVGTLWQAARSWMETRPAVETCCSVHWSRNCFFLAERALKWAAEGVKDRDLPPSSENVKLSCSRWCARRRLRPCAACGFISAACAAGPC